VGRNVATLMEPLLVVLFGKNTNARQGGGRDWTKGGQDASKAMLMVTSAIAEANSGPQSQTWQQNESRRQRSEELRLMRKQTDLMQQQTNMLRRQNIFRPYD